MTTFFIKILSGAKIAPPYYAHVDPEDQMKISDSLTSAAVHLEVYQFFLEVITWFLLSWTLVLLFVTLIVWFKARKKI